MGQNSSSNLNTSSTLPRTKPRAVPEAVPQTSPVAIPVSLPDSPSKSSYLVPENKVLPSDNGDIGNARKHLRPVSQDLAKFHPDYADIFPGGLELEGEDKGGSIRRSASMPGLDKENSAFDISSVQGHRANGHARALSNVPNGYHLMSRSGGDLGSPSVDGNTDQWNDLRRAQSVDRGISAPVKTYRHSRQTSLASRNSLQDTVILEDPREHLYNIARKEPFSDLVPSTTSLPVKSSFEMDYSFNLTYAQLAEHRRQKRTKELEEKTGKKLEDLTADINAASTVPKSPFDLRNLGDRPSTHSVSTGSSDSGVSKSKKKKAPAPPPPPVAPFRYTLINEPPVDYEMQSIAPQPRTKRSNSSASGKTKSPAPQPLPKRHSMTALQDSPAKAASQPNQIPVPASLSTFFNKPSSNTRSDKIQPPGFELLQKSKAETQRQLEVLKKLEESLKRVDSGDSVALKGNPYSDKNPANVGTNASNLKLETESETKLDSANNNSATQQASNIPPPPPIQSLTSNSKPASTQNSSVKTMNSLLQNDIVLAAQARGTKILKPKIPVVPEKPKDPAEIFQEELARAALAREERRKSTTSNSASAEPENDLSLNKNGGEDRVLLFESNNLKVTKSSPTKVKEELSSDSPKDKNGNCKNAQENDSGKNVNEKFDEDELDEMKIAEKVDLSKRSSIQSEAMSISSSNNSQRMFASDWIPEVDLDFDDDIMDQKITMSHKRVSSEGFKSSIIPSKLNDLQNAKEQKKKKSRAFPSSASLGDITSAYPPVEENNQFGSLRKFKQGVRNAFGSISKASGKLFKKPKSKDKYKAESVEDVFQQSGEGRLGEFLRDQNWVLSDSRGNSLQRYKNPSLVGSESDVSSYFESDDVGDIDFASGIDQLPSPRHYEKDNDENANGLKRAGVAYVSKKGQIIVLPEYKYGSTEEARVDRDEDDGRAPKIVKKKNKKYAYESTVGVQQKSRFELEVAKEILEREKQIEFERQRQINMEKDFQRLRDLETQERLHRLQSATIKDQIDLLQQQRAQYEVNNNVSGVTSQAYPSYYPNGGVGLGNPSYLNNFVPIVGTNLMSNSMPTGYTSAHGTPLAGNRMMGGGVVGGQTVPQLTPQEINRISEYMRCLGVAPPANQQQWAVLLSTVSFNSPGFPGYDQKSTLYAMGSGPNLSDIFKSGKTMESAATDNSRHIVSYVPHQQTFLNSDGGVTADRASHAVNPANPHLQSPSDVQQELQHSTVSVGSSPASRQGGPVDLSPIKSPTMSPKVYGPLGYRPMSYQNHIT